jgi:hypothetical protein
MSAALRAIHDVTLPCTGKSYPPRRVLPALRAESKETLPLDPTKGGDTPATTEDILA